MRPPRFFQRSHRRLLPLSLLVLAILTSLTGLAHAATYVGYGQSNVISSTCGSNCEPTTAQTNGIGTIITAPFTGNLVSAGFFTGSQVPNQIVIMTGTVTSTAYSCGGAGTCARANAGGTMTVQDVEALTGLAGSTFFTVNLANPVAVTQNQLVGIVFMSTTGSTVNGLIMFADNGGNTAFFDTGIAFGTTNPTVGNSFACCATGLENGPHVVGGGFTIQGTTGNVVTVTQCYGNCGSPAVTLANTNSTHGINFNQSIMIFYEFQANVNGFLLNVTTSLAKSYSGMNGAAVAIGVYQVVNCPSGQSPFTPTCPGQLVLGKSAVVASKGRFSAVATSGQIAVTNGQWLAVAFTSAFSGLDLNDTNTNVPLFQASSPGGNVLNPTIQQASSASSLCGGCKTGLWAWIIGNVVSGGGPTSPNQSCQSFATIDCWMPALVNGFCSQQTQSCQTSSALFWILFLSVIFEIVIAMSFNRISPNLKVPFGEMFIFIVLMLTFLMTGLALLVLWVPVFLFMVGSIIFSKHTGRYF